MLVQKCANRLRQIFNAHNVDHTHGIQHAMIIVEHGKKAVQANEKLPDLQKEDIILACLLHDADDKKYFPNHKKCDNARVLLEEIGLSSERIENIIDMISVVSYSKNGDSIDKEKGEEFYYPRYCDRLDAIGYKGLIRCYEYSKVIANPISTPKTQKPQNREHLEKICTGRDQIYMKKGGKSDSVIDHIYDKLFHLKLPLFITNSYLQQMFAEGKQEIIDFVLRHSSTNFQNAQQELQSAIAQRNN